MSLLNEAIKDEALEKEALEMPVEVEEAEMRFGSVDGTGTN